MKNLCLFSGYISNLNIEKQNINIFCFEATKIYSLFVLSVVPGGRDVFAKVIRVAPPSNFYPSQLALAAGFAFFHGQLLRKITGGQLPVVI